MLGVVQFDPREGEAGGKAVRNITVNQNGFGPTAVKVSATLWPSHAHVAVEKNDVVLLEGKYNKGSGTNQEGEPVTYHNLSVSRIAVLGKTDPGKEVASDDNDVPAEEPADDEIPF